MLATRMRSSGVSDFYPYKIDESCRFNDNDSAYLYRTPASTETDPKKWTLSTWIKRCNLGEQYLMKAGPDDANRSQFWFSTTNQLWYYCATAGVSRGYLGANIQFRDVGSWYHIVVALDAVNTQITYYVNGVEITAQTVNAAITNADHVFNTEVINVISRNSWSAVTYFDGYLAEMHMIDGLELTPSSFGQLKNGIWIPKKYTGSYGTNGFYLDFGNSADLGNDVSGNGNDFASSGLATNDQVLDSPTNNYPVLSSVNKPPSTPTDNGGLNYGYASAAWVSCLATMAFPSTGKWYFEYKLGTTDIAYIMIGIKSPHEGSSPITVNQYLGMEATSWGFYSNGTNYYKYHSASGTILTGDTPSASDVMQFAIDMDAGKVWFGSNNTWLTSGDPAAGTNEMYSGLPDHLVPAMAVHSYVDTAAYINFGQLGFAYTPPTGFKALCSDNLSTPTVKNSATGFDVVLYEGNGTVRNITDLAFQPDLVWIKNRDATDFHRLVDSVRGVTKEIYSNDVTIEAIDANGLTAFLSNGFTLGTGAGGYNDNAESFVAWCFKMGAAYGFDIQTYTGTGVAKAENHDLGGVPELMFLKNLDTGHGWIVYHYHASNRTDPETDYGWLQLSNAWADSNTPFNDTAPTSTQFTVGTYVGVNENTKEHVAYLWRSIPQFSKVFSYFGNGNADGAVVYCGFKPRFVIIKAASGVASWVLFDTERDTYNESKNVLLPDGPNVEQPWAGLVIDILSNGFKVRGTHGCVGTNVILYVGIAYAEQAGKWSNAN